MTKKLAALIGGVLLAAGCASVTPEDLAAVRALKFNWTVAAF